MAVRTEGSWIFGPYELVWAASDIGFADGRWHEVVSRPRIVATPASPADGPMLAAAPDLYEALAALHRQALQTPELREHEWGREAIDMANTALAKARGEAE